jgi:uncharacterized protein YndB with AHSA1/START domain
MYVTRVSQHVNAPRAAVYRALLDADAITRWRVPAGMRSQVHEFDAREGGAFRVSLTYDAPESTGKSARHTDTYHGHFRTLEPDEQVVEVFEFETGDPALRGTMTMTTTLTDAAGGTNVLIVHEGIPDAIPAADNETGMRMALANLARLLEAPPAEHRLAEPKATLHDYLRTHRDQLLAKLDGLGERDLRWPMTPTGTNLLGLIKHVASVQLGYLGDVFDRPADRVLPWFDEGAELNADMWATADESSAEIIDLYTFSSAHADATIEALDLDATGVVSWWPPERRRVTLHQILVRMTTEVARHAGHADIIRELLDGSAGNKDGNLPDQTEAEWSAYRSRLERAAEAAATRD